MKQLWIGLIVAGAIAGCRNGPNNARDTTGMGSQGSAGGSLPGDTTGMSAGATATPPAPMTSDTTKRDTTKRDTTKRDTAQANATKHHKKSHKHP